MKKVYPNNLEVSIIFLAIRKVLHIIQFKTRYFVHIPNVLPSAIAKKIRRLL